MTSDQILAITRAILTAIGGFFVGKGMISSDMFNWITGGILTIAPIIWAWIAHRPANMAASVQAQPGVNVQTSAAAPQSVKDAVAAAKQGT